MQNNQPRRGNYVGTALLCAVYLLLAGTTLVWAISAYTPCTSNFEGGCSMGRAYVAIFSCLTAAGAAGLGLLFKRALASVPKVAPHAKIISYVLAGVPAAYFLWTVKNLFAG